LDIKAIS